MTLNDLIYQMAKHDALETINHHISSPEWCKTSEAQTLAAYEMYIEMGRLYYLRKFAEPFESREKRQEWMWRQPSLIVLHADWLKHAALDYAAGPKLPAPPHPCPGG